MKDHEVNKEIRQARNAYKRAWRKRNPDKERTYQKRYWLKKAAQMDAKEADDERQGSDFEM